jgi:gliding motility-associated-like protein
MLIKKIKYCFLLIAILHIKTICSGQNGYGAPVYKQDFGVGNSNSETIGTPLPPGRTFFKFESSVCPMPGNYTIERRVPVANCFNNQWIGLSHDNNPAIDYGMMMVVNNNYNANHRLVYIDTVNKTLCAGEEYRFSAAIINLDLIDGWAVCPNGPDYPVFEFRVEDGSGNLIMKDTTAPLTSYAAPPLMGYKFREDGIDFIAPTGINKLILKITLFHLAYACAEDFAIDDIQLRPRGPGSVIKFDNEPSTTIVKSVCFQHNTTVSMSGTVENYYTNTALQWQQSTDNGATWTDIPGATSLTYSKAFSVPDTFLFRLTASEAVNIGNPNCRVASNTRKVEVDGLPTGYQITNNSPVCAGHDLKFEGSGAASYIWSGPNGFSDNIPFPHIFFSSLNDSGWYYVDVYSLGGCKVTDSTHATVIGTDVHAKPDTSICKGNTVKLEASAGASYIWTPSAGLSSTTVQSPRAKPDVTTVYTVEVTDNFGCSDTALVQVQVLNKVELNAVISATEFLCRPFDSVTFKSTSTGNISKWYWDFNNGQMASTEQPSVQYYSMTSNDRLFTIRLTIADTTGCTDTAYHFIKVMDNCYIAVPTAFTPNGDGLNDYLYPLNAFKATDLSFKVFNRYGQLVFSSKNWLTKWDGKINGVIQPTGVYVWMLDYTDTANKKISLKGTTLLIR